MHRIHLLQKIDTQLNNNRMIVGTSVNYLVKKPAPLLELVFTLKATLLNVPFEVF